MVATIFGACSHDKGFGPPKNGSGDSGQGGTGGGDLLPPDDGGPPPLDAQGLCGNQLHTLIFDSPNVYFIIDASGSMSQPAGSTSRFAVVRKAAINLVRDLGPLINVGAALFPVGATDQAPCVPGAEVMPITPGDAYTGADGPTTNQFKSVTSTAPNGGTPTSATLAALLPSIQAAPGKTIVLLVTDGGPNCNGFASCDGAHCGPNIEGCTGDACCDPGGNCCAPGAPGGASSCVDTDATVVQIEAYEKAGLPVYVIGIPGSEAYAGVLQQMAIAAGTAQIAKPYYYAVSDVDNLHGVLASIAAVAVSCIFTLDDPPKVEDQTNVYLDGVILPSGGNDGWRWMDPDLLRIELLGDSCARLKAGQIKTVQIVSGCPTEPSK